MKKSLCALSLLLLSACTRGAGGEAQVRKDFDTLCAAQRDFLEARKLKGVNEAELVLERTRWIQERVTQGPALGLLDQLSRASAPDQRETGEKAAREAGLQNWSCPELSHWF